MRPLSTLVTLAGAAATVALASASAPVQDPAPGVTVTVKTVVKAEAPAQDEARPAEAEKAAVVEKAAEAPADEIKTETIVVERLVVGRAAPMGAVAEADDDPDKLDPEALQYAQQLRPMLRGELHRLRLVAKPSDDQFQAISKDSRRALNAAARDIVKQMRNGMMNNENFPDPVTKIGSEMLAIAKNHLSAEQFASYEAEHERQIARQKMAAIRLLVAAMDDDLTLTAEQRKQLEEAIRTKWTDSLSRALAVAQFGRQYLPALPDPVVVPVLTDRQKKLWEEQKRNRQQIFGFFWHTPWDNGQLEPQVTDEPIAQEAMMIAVPAAVAPAEAIEVEAFGETVAEPATANDDAKPEE